MKKFLVLQSTLSFSKTLRGLAFVISLTLLSACAISGEKEVAGITNRPRSAAKEILAPSGGHIDFDIAQGLRVYNNASVYLSALQVNVAANQALETKPKALFVPFGLVQSSNDSGGISYGVSRLLWQQFLAEQTFSTLEFSEVPPPYRVEHAIQGAKALGARFLVGGYITHFIDGATVGDSKIAIQLEVYDTETGMLLWAISQSGILPYKTDKNNILFTVHNRMPIDAMSTLVSAMGANMAQYLHYWTDPEGMNAQDPFNKAMEDLAPRAF